MKSHIDLKSFLIGALSLLLLVSTISAAVDNFSQDEISRLRQLARYLQPDGNLNIGNKKIIMQGSTIYDDSSEGGGLIIRGGKNRVNIHGDAILPDGNLNIGNKKIIMLGSMIYDDASEGGGLQLRGGGNRIHFFGKTIQH